MSGSTHTGSTAGSSDGTASERTITPASPAVVPQRRRVLQRVLPTVGVGSFTVADVEAAEMIEHLAAPGRGRVVAFALHIGGLNDASNTGFVAAMNRADVVYADGKSVEWVARAAGATRIQRAATTDIGIPVLRALSRNLGRRARVALIGARPGVAAEAALTIEADAGTETVLVEHGYHQDWADVLERVRAAKPDVVIVGLGMPLEARWVDEHRVDLPETLIMTCGGWLGFLAGDEQRAPEFAQRSGAEWLYRLRQQPLHLGPRYARGLVTFGRLYLKARISGTPGAPGKSRKSRNSRIAA